MMRAYDESYLYYTTTKLGEMFEEAVLFYGIDIDEFGELFSLSNLSTFFEESNPIYVLGKSSSELLGLLLNIEPIDYNISEDKTPEYWVGYIYSYVQWYTGLKYQDIMKTITPSELVLCYFPYHEMDVMHIINLFIERMNIKSPLITKRKERGLSQNDLAILSHVNIRNIRAYEQGTIDISKAQGDTLYRLSKVLGCTIEELIL